MALTWSKIILVGAACIYMVACKSTGGGDSASGVKSLTDKGFQYDKFTVVVRSSDGLPVENVSIAFQLDAISFKWSNPFVITPNFKPGYYDSAAKNGEIGHTNADGRIELTNVTYESKYSQPTRIVFNADDQSVVFCDENSSQNTTRFYRIMTGAIKGKTPQDSDQYGRCGRLLAHDNSDPKEVTIECVTARTQQQILDEAAALKQANCP